MFNKWGNWWADMLENAFDLCSDARFFIPVLVVAGSLLLWATFPTYSYSDTLLEKGTVVQTMFNAGFHGTTVGLSSDGNMTVGAVSAPKSWGVVFLCEHGSKFSIYGSSRRDYKLWTSLDEGDDVEISYREKYLMDDGEPQLYDYDFIDANKVK